MSNDHPNGTPGHDKAFTIIVNGRPREVADHRLSYWQVVQLAYPGDQPDPNKVYTVTYSNPHGKDGTLTEGQEVEIKDGMVFNVVKTNRS